MFVSSRDALIALTGRSSYRFIRLRLGLFERFGRSFWCFLIDSVPYGYVLYTWINFLYVTLKEIPMWPRRESVQSCMPTCFKQLYPTARVIIDATEIFIEHTIIARTSANDLLFIQEP